jgi:hypothetical protein
MPYWREVEKSKTEIYLTQQKNSKKNSEKSIQKGEIESLKQFVTRPKELEIERENGL